MDFFSDGTANGGVLMSRRNILGHIGELYEKIDEENGKREELILEIARIEHAIERFRLLVSDMEALLK